MSKKTIKDHLIGQVPEDILNKINKSFEIVGDIAIIEILDDDVAVYEELIAEKVMLMNPRVNVVLKKFGIHHGEFRTQKLEHVKGPNRKETEYIENGIRLKINPETVYFSSKLSTERQDLMENLKENKRVLVMFSGAGPYTFVALKKQPNLSRIDSIEINPNGHMYAIENLKLNKNLIKKSNLFKETIQKLKENNLPIIEKKIISNLNKLKVHFFNYDVKDAIENIKLDEYNYEFEFFDNEIFETADKVIFESLKNKEEEILYINLDKIRFDKLKHFLILFADEFDFICQIEDKTFLFDSDYKKGLLLNILESYDHNKVDKYDEIFMPLPKDAYDFLDCAFKFADNRCIIHMYDFVHENDFPHETENKVLAAAASHNCEIKIIQTRKVGQYSPRKYRVCCDFILIS